jgi:hypothetical protein
VFLARASNGSHYALKRISVNNRKDLEVGKLEISIMVRKNITIEENFLSPIKNYFQVKVG